jgi:hypothetical protein
MEQATLPLPSQRTSDLTYVVFDVLRLLLDPLQGGRLEIVALDLSVEEPGAEDTLALLDSFDGHLGTTGPEPDYVTDFEGPLRLLFHAPYYTG